MKAVYYEEHGDTDVLQYGEQPDPEYGRDEVCIDVKAGGLNHLDVWTRRGMPSPGAFPHIPGSDAAGVVTEVGEDVTRFEPGDRVAVSPATSCGKCEFCRDGDSSLCESFALIGEHMGGVHSELAAVPEENLVPVPDHVDFVTAASAPLVFQTAWRMMVTRAEVDQSDSVLVLGASGGVGHAALQMAVNAGAEVYATASSEEKLEYARELGAHHTVNYETEDFADWIRSETDGRGVDVVVDHVGDATWGQSIKSCAKGGRIVTCGATSGPKAETNLASVFWKQLTILGSTMGTEGEIDDALAKVWDGTFESRIRAVLPMSETARAHEMLQDREGFGTVVVVPDSEWDEEAYAEYNN
jgi:NADPH2:quinone reductase